MSDRKLTLTVIALGLFAITCGGSVVERDGEGGTAGAEAGAGGTAGKGTGGQAGATSKGGAAGAAAQGGSGGYAGVAGSGAYGGWAGSGGSVCPPLPSCNWCNGTPYYDSSGCVAGWTCANGINPCVTQPCHVEGCQAGYTCAEDGLCWPGEPVCSPKQCNGTNNYCECFWLCGSSKYETKCKVSGSAMSCECIENGKTAMGCGTTGGGGGSPPFCQNSCCGFPEGYLPD